MRLRVLATVLAFGAAALAQPANWASRGIGGGGALYNPVFNPSNPAEMYAGCDMSELFHSVDTGHTWNIEHFSVIQGGNHVGVQFTSDPQVRYSVDYTNDGMTPVKTTDGGTSWSALIGDPTGGACWEMAVDPNHTTNLLVVDYTHLYYSSNGGSSFALKYTSPMLGGAYIAGTFWDLPNIYVGTNAGLLVSTDGGSTFNMQSYTGLPAGQGMLSFAGAKQGGTVRFYGVAADTANIYVGIFGSDYWNIAKGIYSTSGQVVQWTSGPVSGAGILESLNPRPLSFTWTLKEKGIQIGTDYPFFVAMAQNDTSTAYLAGSGSAGAPTVFKTTTAGDTWVETLLAAGNQNIYTGWCGSGGDRGWGYAECAMGFSVAANNPSLLAFSDYGFIHLSSDDGQNWRQCYVSAATQNSKGSNITPGRFYQGVGLENTSCWDVLWLNQDSVFVGSTDINGIHSTDAGMTWAIIPNLNLNSVYRLVEHPQTHVLYAAISSVHDLYQSTYLTDARIDGGNGNVKFSTDRGASWNTLHNFAKPVIWIELDPNRPNRMYAAVANHNNGQGGIWVTNDLQNGATSSWTHCTAPPRTQGHPFNIRVLNDGTVLASYSGRIDSSSHFTASSGVFASTDSGQTWQDKSAAGMDYWTMDLVVDPYDSLQNTWYGCVFSGWGGPPNGLGGLYRTTDRGSNWTRINSLDRVGSCTVSPRDSNEMYLTTEVNGLWYCQNLRSGNPTFGLANSYPFRHPERVFYSPYDTSALWVTSFGAGLRIGSTATGVSSERKSGRSHAGVLAFRQGQNMVFERLVPGSRVVVRDNTGRLVQDSKRVNSAVWRWNVSHVPSGVYCYSVASPNGNRDLGKVVVVNR
ncbi:MAG TPA: hypothetical protein VMH22_01705 [bacterium]|nr:hypothetical protein [bacterium]